MASQLAVLLRQRAQSLRTLRAHFTARGLLEVDTPYARPAASPEPYVLAPKLEAEARWLATSPEMEMKRLIAEGSGPIFQVARAFRKEELGRWHLPEFTLVEWYLLEPCVDALVESTTQLIRCLGELWSSPLAKAPIMRRSFEAAWLTHASMSYAEALDRDEVDAHWAFEVQPKLGLEGLEFITPWPAAQASLAARDPRGHALRVEAYWQGIELANGFVEECSGDALRDYWAGHLPGGLAHPGVDAAYLAMLDAGQLAPCAGIALGFDRLLACLLGASSLAEVVPFAPQPR